MSKKKETSYNVEAAKIAAQKAGATCPDLTKAQRATFRQAMINFVKKPGFTIGDIMRALPFDQERALTVATTEITNMFAEAEEINGKKLKKEYPDIRVVKRWFTCNDNLVCPICAPLHGKEVEITKDFARGISRPAAHDGCRCWISTRTRI